MNFSEWWKNQSPSFNYWLDGELNPNYQAEKEAKKIALLAWEMGKKEQSEKNDDLNVGLIIMQGQFLADMAEEFILRSDNDRNKPNIATGRGYVLSKNDLKIAIERFKEVLPT